MQDYSCVNCSFCWDNNQKTSPQYPLSLGTPREDQLQGKPADQLIELMGRICYDSLGTGRSSKDYHQHIREVGHLSVLEHAYFTFRIYQYPLLCIEACHSRPGVFCHISDNGDCRITLNLRSAIEWDAWSLRLGKTRYYHDVDYCIRNSIVNILKEKTDYIFQDVSVFGEKISCEQDEPEIEFEKWITLYVSGSRAFANELIRHRAFTAVSQRSTRYCPEDESSHVLHPLIKEYLGDQRLDGQGPILDRGQYKQWFERLYAWIVARGVDKSVARKQARGAARSLLELGLETELFFSANVWQWKQILDQRGSVHADAEIREFAVLALYALRKSRFAKDFDEYFTSPSPDGIGQILTRKTS